MRWTTVERAAWVLGIALFGTLPTGCGGGGGDSTPPPVVPNAGPAVSASAPQPLTADTSFTLVGAATDPEGDPLTFLWEVVSTPAGATPLLLSPAAATTDVGGVLPAGDYEFRFTADDGDVQTQALVGVTLEAPGLLASVFVADREAWPLGGQIPITSASAAGPTFAQTLFDVAYAGGWSGLARARDAQGGPLSDEFWIVDDRGPNYGIAARVPQLPMGATAFGTGAKVFPLPGHQQRLSRVRLHRATGTVEVLSQTPIFDRAGLAVNGLPSNVLGMTTNEKAFSDVDDKDSLLAKTPQGFDFEGVFHDRMTIGGVDKRVFWTCDEYGPSIQMIEGDPASPAFGRMLREYIPGATPDVPAGLFALPAVLRNRRDNRGFEGIGVTKTAVWGMVQSSFSGGQAKPRLQRLVRVDKLTGVVTMYGYDHVEDPVALGSSHAGVKVGDMVALSDCEMLVLEHDGASFVHVYRIRVVPGTSTELTEANGLGYEQGTTPYVPVEKTLVADLTDVLGDLAVPTKPEGLVLVDPCTLALCFDNDYGHEGNESHVYAQPGLAQRNMLITVKLPKPVLPSLHFVAELSTGLVGANAEIVDVEPSSGLTFVTCDQDQSVFVFDGSNPTAPWFVRRDAMPAGSATSVAVHPTHGYYVVAVRGGGGGGDDILEVRRCSDGFLLRTISLGVGRGPDAVKISPNGRFAVVCNEAEDPWLPGSISTLDLGAGPYLTPGDAASGIGPVNEIALSGLVPSVGGFSTRWINRPYNAPPPGVTITGPGGTVQIVSGEVAATYVGGAPIGANDVLTVTYGATVITPVYFVFDGAVSGGNDGNMLIVQLDASALSMEPEIAAFDAASTLAVVTLQENNAVAVVDLTLNPPALRATNGVMGLGNAVHADADTVRDSGSPDPALLVNALNLPREPDGASVVVLGGVPCFLTVDEGDSWGPAYNTSSNSRIRGGRTLSIFRLDDGTPLGDTGNQLALWADQTGRWQALIDASRARRGGTEPENVDTIALDGRTLAVVGLERANAVALVDVTCAAYPTVIDLAGIGSLAPPNTRQAPEGIKIRQVGGRTFAYVAYELSGTVGIFEIK
jgi:hypothetical protein